jgi:hypothetical protein
MLVPEEGVIIDRPDATTILGAGKILGETAAGTKYGIIEAVTDEEFGVWEYEIGDSVLQENGMLEPMTNYFIGRVEQPVFNNLSTVGLMMTDLRRNENGYANVLGLDWKLAYPFSLRRRSVIIKPTVDKLLNTGCSTRPIK